MLYPAVVCSPLLWFAINHMRLISDFHVLCLNISFASYRKAFIQDEWLPIMNWWKSISKIHSSDSNQIWRQNTSSLNCFSYQRRFLLFNCFYYGVLNEDVSQMDSKRTMTSLIKISQQRNILSPKLIWYAPPDFFCFYF